MDGHDRTAGSQGLQGRRRRGRPAHRPDGRQRRAGGAAAPRPHRERGRRSRCRCTAPRCSASSTSPPTTWSRAQPTRRWGNQHPNLVPYQVVRRRRSRAGARRRQRRAVPPSVRPAGASTDERLSRPRRRGTPGAARRGGRPPSPRRSPSATPRRPSPRCARPASRPRRCSCRTRRSRRSRPPTPEALVAIAHPQLGEVRLPAPPLEGDGVRRDHTAPPLPGEGGEELAARWALPRA